MPVALPDLDTRQDTKQEKKFYPNFRVILHNDDSLPFEIVIPAIMEVMNFSTEKTVSIVIEAHNNDKAEVIVCCEEHAEHYSSSLNSKGLTTTIEPISE